MINRNALHFATIAGVVVACFLVQMCIAISAECPKDAKSCKVLVLTPDEEQTLITLVQNTGVQGPFNQIKSAVDAWVKRIQEAPAGEVPKAPEKK